MSSLESTIASVGEGLRFKEKKTGEEANTSAKISSAVARSSGIKLEKRGVVDNAGRKVRFKSRIGNEKLPLPETYLERDELKELKFYEDRFTRMIFNPNAISKVLDGCDFKIRKLAIFRLSCKMSYREAVLGSCYSSQFKIGLGVAK